MVSISGVLLTPLKIIDGPSGQVMHALKNFDPGFVGFGEAYFSTVGLGQFKGWKKHLEMQLNVVVPFGCIRFILFDGRPASQTYKLIQEFELGPHNYQRLTVPPGIWMGFEGLSPGTNMLLNLASIPHNPSEAESLPFENDLIPYRGKN
jgi:dTDP-4-dehydrorhamnose 3,5-epimerase